METIEENSESESERFIEDGGESPKKKATNEQFIKKPLDLGRVLQILECRRKVMNFVESMLEPSITIEDLRAGEEFLCRRDYDDIVQERHILRLCGYPLCSNAIIKDWKQKYHIGMREKRIYDVEIRKLYCSVVCMDTSHKYRDENLPEQPFWMRLDDIRMGPEADLNLQGTSASEPTSPNHQNEMHLNQSREDT